MTFKYDLDLSLHRRGMLSAHRITERNISVKIIKVVERVHEILSGHELEGKYHDL